MARRYRLWVERDENNEVVSCGLTPLGASRQPSAAALWDGAPAVDGFPFGEPWALLLALLDMERRIQPEGWPFGPGGGWREEIEANEGIPRPDWVGWKRLAAEAGAPYLETEDQGHPLIWFPGTDGEWYGFLLDTGVMAGQTHWWIPGMEQFVKDPATGQSITVPSPLHAERPGSKTIREVLPAAPEGLFDADAQTQLRLHEVLNEVFAQYSQEQIARFRFYVYKSDAGHHLLFETRSIVEREMGYGSGYGFVQTPNVFLWDPQYKPYAFETLEAVRADISAFAWTWLSPLAHLWNPFLRADFGTEFGQDPNVTQVETAQRLASLSPRRKCALTCTGLGGRSGGDPLAHLLGKARAERQLVPGSAPRTLPTLLEKAKDEFWLQGETDQAKGHRRQQTASARRQLTNAARFREVLVTTDLFAAAAWELAWAVDAEKILLSCPHPGCGRAFFREYTAERFCPKHRDPRARKARSLRKRKRDKDS